MFSYGAYALLALATPAMQQGQCLEATENYHVPDIDLTANVQEVDGKLVRQDGTLQFGASVGPFRMAVHYPGPGLAADQVAVFVQSEDLPAGPDNIVKLTAANGKSWLAQPSAAPSQPGPGRNHLEAMVAAKYVFVSPQQPDPELIRLLDEGGRFDLEWRRAGTVRAGERLNSVPIAFRTAMHRGAVERAIKQMEPCAKT